MTEAIGNSDSAKQAPPLVYVVDDEAVFREAVTELVAAIGVEVRAYARPSEMLADLDDRRLGCAIIDMRLPEMSGIELLARLSTIPAIILSGHGDVPSAVRALKAGAIDFLEKPIRPQELIDKIQALLSGAELQAERRRAASRMREILPQLSDRQRQILPLVADGCSAKEIGRRLGLSHRTVEKHRAALMEKLNVSSAGDLVRLAAQATGFDPEVMPDKG